MVASNLGVSGSRVREARVMRRQGIEAYCKETGVGCHMLKIRQFSIQQSRKSRLKESRCKCCIRDKTKTKAEMESGVPIKDCDCTYYHITAG